jgi:hypothetical protein
MKWGFHLFSHLSSFTSASNYAHVYDNGTEQGLVHLKGLSSTALAPVGGGLALFTEMSRRLVSLVKSSPPERSVIPTQVQNA